jgi:hypothetical protein
MTNRNSDRERDMDTWVAEQGGLERVREWNPGMVDPRGDSEEGRRRHEQGR